MEARQRTVIQLKLVLAVVRSQQRRYGTDRPLLDGVLQRSLTLLDGMRPELAGDTELQELYDQVRAEVERLGSSSGRDSEGG